MKEGCTQLPAELPVPEAGELVSRAIRLGVSMQEYIAYHVLRSAFGALHPVVAAFEDAHLGNGGGIGK